MVTLGDIRPIRVTEETRETLEDVYRRIGWWTEESVVPEHHRIYDRVGLINVVTEEMAWELLEDRGLIVRTGGK